jgi:hypothetical protein
VFRVQVPQVVLVASVEVLRVRAVQVQALRVPVVQVASQVLVLFRV